MLKLKRMTTGCKILVAALVPLCAVLAGCPTRPPAAAPAAGAVAPPPVSAQEGRPYDIAAADSLLTIRVYRGGPLAQAGHNHVIASHSLRGTFYVPAELARTTLEARLPVAELTVDEAPLRAQEAPADFPPDVPDSAREGTRGNMLGRSLLQADEYPDIVLRLARLDPAVAAAARAATQPSDWIAHIRVTVRDHESLVTVPVHCVRQGDSLLVSGAAPLRQTDLGLKPFSALLGALQVLDEMQIRFRIVARAATTRSELAPQQ